MDQNVPGATTLLDTPPVNKQERSRTIANTQFSNQLYKFGAAARQMLEVLEDDPEIKAFVQSRPSLQRRIAALIQYLP